MITSLDGHTPPSFRSLYPVGATRYHSTLNSNYSSFDNKRFNAAYGSAATAADADSVLSRRSSSACPAWDVYPEASPISCYHPSRGFGRGIGWGDCSGSLRDKGVW